VEPHLAREPARDTFGSIMLGGAFSGVWAEVVEEEAAALGKSAAVAATTSALRTAARATSSCAPARAA
jgi:hypothetical protein